MKKIFTAFVFCFLCGECFSQAGMWTWIKGDSILNPAPVWGIQGISNAANKPPGLYEPCQWTDLNGNFWILGGNHTAANGLIYGDLWKYNPILNMWTWMKGDSTLISPGNYGIKGIPSISNFPPARGFGAASWVDFNGNLWLFGGGGNGSLNDLWKYEIATNMWTWMNGSSNTGQIGVYGIPGIPSSLNTPGARDECAANWVDNNGDLWLFGGHDIYDHFNDLWRYTISTNEWTWMKGSNLVNQGASYGSLGIPNPANIPGSRQIHGFWKDQQGYFWLFGGENYNGAIYNVYNDMWKYEPQSNNFTWMSGTNLPNNSGNYGTICTGTLTNLPAARKENRATWVDKCGNFWMYGGYTYIPNQFFQDLWQFSPLTLTWKLVNGNALPNQLPVYGNLGIPSPLNTPGGRTGSVSWNDSIGNLYLFGGFVFGFYSKNDLWKFAIDTNCTPLCSSTNIQENNFTNDLLVFPNPANSSLTVSFSSPAKQTVELRIYNTLGKQIYFSPKESIRTKEEITKGKFEKEINVEKWSDGIYFLQVKMREGNMNRKVVVNHF